MKRPWLTASVVINILLIFTLYILLNRLGGIPYVIFKATIAGTGSGVSVGRAEHFELLKDTKNEIIFLGDSITQQAEWSELFDDSHVKNRGIGGDSAEKILLRLNEIVSSRPQKVFLMAGINDLASNPKEIVLDRIKEIISFIKVESPNTEIYVQSILPVNNSIRKTGRSNSDIEFINKKLNAFSITQSNVIWVDLASHFSDKNGLLNSDFTHDGLHLNGSAYLKWREVILPYF